MNILLTAIGGPSAICFAKSLRNERVRLIGCNAEDEHIGSRFIDRFYRVPPAHDPTYLPTLKKIVVDEHIDYIIPFVDEELVVLSERGSDVGCSVLLSPAQTIRYTNDKGLAYERLSRFLPKRFSSESASFPLFAKPRIGRGGKGALVVHTPEHLRAIPADSYVFQEILKSPEVTVDAFFDARGALVVAVPRERVEIDQGISVVGDVFENDELTRMIREIATILTFVGPINFQFMQHEQGFRLIEINARASGGSGITMNAGVDMPKLSLALMRGEKLIAPKARPGRYSNFDEVFERQREKRERELQV